MMSGERKPLLVALVEGRTSKQVNVRVGGGWQNLRQYIESYDKCRQDPHSLKIKADFKRMMERLRQVPSSRSCKGWAACLSLTAPPLSNRQPRTCADGSRPTCALNPAVCKQARTCKRGRSFLTFCFWLRCSGFRTRVEYYQQ